MDRLTLGSFDLAFSPGGSLRSLVCAGKEFLFNSECQLPLSDSLAYTVGGWDECFPSIEPTATSPLMGLCIHHPPSLVASPGEATQSWELQDWRLRRTFSVETDGALRLDFSAQNRSDIPQSFLWASHAIFSCEGVLRIDLPGRTLTEFTNNHSCEKFFLPATSPAIITRHGVLLELSTDQPHWGIWLNRGGWPRDEPAGLLCVGIEATNTCGEVPGDDALQPGESFCGWVSLRTLSDG